MVRTVINDFNINCKTYYFVQLLPHDCDHHHYLEEGPHQGYYYYNYTEILIIMLKYIATDSLYF